MMKLLKYLLMMVLVSVTGMVCAQNALPPAAIPEFTVYDMDSKPFTRNDFPKKGKIVIIFYDPGCGYCQKEAQTIGKNYDKFKDASFYFVSMQDKPLIQEFMDKYGGNLMGKSNVKFLHDANYEFINKFHPKEFPSTYVYAANHRLVKYLHGDTSIKTFIAVVNQ